MTRHELANWIGTAKETLIRCLSEFKAENLIRQDDEGIDIIDLQKLNQVSGDRAEIRSHGDIYHPACL